MDISISADCHNKSYRLGGLSRNLSFTVLEAGSVRSKSDKVDFWWGFPSWLVQGCRVTSSHGLSSVLVCGCIWRKRESKWEGEPMWRGLVGEDRSLMSLLRTLILSDQRLTLMTAPSLNHFLRGPISKNSHTGNYSFNMWIFRGHFQFSHDNIFFPSFFFFFLKCFWSAAFWLCPLSLSQVAWMLNSCC